VSTKFYTLEAMIDAVVHEVSSQVAAHPAEHALILEPNFAWQTDGSNEQYYLIIDCGKPRQIDALVWIHRHNEVDLPSPVSPWPYPSPSPSPSPFPTGVLADVYHSNDNVTYTQASLSVDPGISGELLKVSEFTVTSAQRYWKIILKGVVPPNYYAPDELRTSALWLARKYEITAGAIFPREDTTIYSKNMFDMPYGEQTFIGFSENEQVKFTRIYTVDDTDYDILMDMLENTNGGESILAMQELDDDPMLVKIESAVSIEKFAIGWRTITIEFATVPIVGRDELY
jgi:hypothetical protein